MKEAEGGWYLVGWSGRLLQMEARMKLVLQSPGNASSRTVQQREQRAQILWWEPACLSRDQPGGQSALSREGRWRVAGMWLTDSLRPDYTGPM